MECIRLGQHARSECENDRQAGPALPRGSYLEELKTVGRSIGEITRATASATANSIGENPREEFELCGDTIFFFASFMRRSNGI